jgi:hypothetical protein
MWDCEVAHYTVGFGKGCFFGLDCFSLAVCVWEEGLRQTLFMDAMLGSVGVSVRRVCGSIFALHLGVLGKSIVLLKPIFLVENGVGEGIQTLNR